MECLEGGNKKKKTVCPSRGFKHIQPNELDKNLE
jgi:hypothetical protein